VTSNRSGSQDLYAFDRAQPGRMVQITRDSAAEVNAVYSPDGTRIAYISTRDGNPEIYVVNATARARSASRPRGPRDSPCWTPDGKQVVFASDRSGKMQVWIMSADGTGAKQLTPDAASITSGGVAGWPDHRVYLDTRWQYEIYLMALDARISATSRSTQVAAVACLAHERPAGVHQ